MRRLLIFLHGYEPRGGALYYKLYRDQAAKHTVRSGTPIHVSPRNSADPRLTTCEFHNWDDLARAHWARGDFGGIRETLRFSWLFLRTGHFSRLLRIDRRAGLVALWPLLTILVPLALALLGVVLVCVLVTALL